MISAIAARRAAQAAQPSNETKAVCLPPSPVELDAERQQKSKRKTSNHIAKLQNKKQRQSGDQRVQSKSVRYFTEQPKRDMFETQDDMIAVDSESDGDGDGEEIDDAPDVMDVLEPVSQPKRKRRWSPSIPVDHSSTGEDSGDRSGNIDLSSLFPHSYAQHKRPELEAVLLSTFEPVDNQNIFMLTADEVSRLGIPQLSQEATLVVLNISETICLLGTCTLVVVHNAISIYGTTLVPSSHVHNIYAPRCAPLPVIEACRNDNHGGQLPKRLEHLISDSVSIILLSGLRTGIEGLGKICHTFDGMFAPSRWSKPKIVAPFFVDGIFMVTEQTKDIQALVISHSWSQALQFIPASDNGHKIYLIKGFKKTGKSTFSRLLLNRLLETHQFVAYLECDLGQSEFMPGGMISLHVISTPIFGPAFTHPTTPYRAHYVGATTPRSSPEYYIEAIADLVQTYRLDLQTPNVESPEDSRISDVIPLVVNTMGWIKGLGESLGQQIEDLLEPTEIFELQAPLFPNGNSLTPMLHVGNVHNKDICHDGCISSTEASARKHSLQPAPSSSLSMNYTPADQRSLCILSYLHATFTRPSNLTIDFIQDTCIKWNTSLPLCAMRPYEVDPAIALDKIVLTGAGSEDVAASEVARVINGALIGLVHCSDFTTIPDTDMNEKEQEQCINPMPYTQMALPPSPSTSSCVGLALVRGVSLVRSRPSTKDLHLASSLSLQILTPVDASRLGVARIFVKGEMELPIWGMLDFRTFAHGECGDVAGVGMVEVPFLQWGRNAEGVVGAERRRVRRNLMRRGQM